jgi:hypothetical protein
MASLRFPTFPEVVNLFTKDTPQLPKVEGAREFVRNAYEKTGGATVDLKRVYKSYLDNERRREAAKG